MAEATTDEMRQAIETLKNYFFQRLFSFHYKYFDKRIGKSNFEVASGFCAIHRDIPLFVACAHFLTGLGKSFSQEVIQEVSIGVPSVTKRLLKFDLDDDTLSAFRYWDEAPCQDFAIGPCDQELQTAMYIAGAKVLKLSPFEFTPDDRGQYFLFGYLSSESRVRVNDLIYVPSDDGFKMHHSSDAGALAPRCIAITPPIQLEDGRLQSELIPNGIQTVEGLSGGFIIKIKPGKQIRDYEFVGVQSEQSVLKDKVVSIRYSDAAVILDCIDHFCDSLQPIDEIEQSS